MATGHVFAMSFNHISEGFLTAEVPTWEIHFPGMVPAKRRLCGPIVSMILQLVCKWLEACLASLPEQLIPKPPSSPCSAQPWGRRSPWAHPAEGPRAVLSYVVWGRSETGRGNQDTTGTWHEIMASARSTGLWSPAYRHNFSSKMLVSGAFSQSLLCFVGMEPLPLQM